MKKNWFLNCFPTPNFLKMPSVGIDISDEYIRFVEIVDDGCNKILGKFGKVPLPEDVVVSGEVKNEEKLVEILKSIKKEHKFNFIRASLTERNSYIFKTTITKKENMSAGEIRGSLGFKMEENVPIKSEETIFDFDVTKINLHDLDIVVSALPKNIVEQFIVVFEKAGLKPLSFEVEAQAVARAVVSSKSNETFMVVDLRRRRAGLSIVKSGVVRFTATLDIDENDLSNAIENYSGASLEEAQKTKKGQGSEKIKKEENFLYSAVAPLTVLKDEINKNLIYWHTHRDNVRGGKILNKVQEIILCGSGGSLRGLDDYLSLSIGLSVEKANVWGNLFSFDDIVPEISFEDSLEYAPSIGLAMRTDERIFLYPQKIRYIE